MATEKLLLEMRHVEKEFPGVKALDDVSIDVYRGEVMALLGENGAGKSTLMKILGGAYNRDSGEILVDGRELPLQYGPLDGQNLGIGIIYQELSLLPHLTVAENIYLAKEPLRSRWLRMIDYQTMRARAREQLAKLEAEHIPVQAKVATLSLPEQQMVEIAKALAIECRVIIMDEPTTTLSWEDTKKLFNVIRALKKQNVTIIYISHRLNEIFQIADRATILRDGKVVGDLQIAETNMDEIVTLMTGRSLTSFSTADVVDHTEQLRKAVASKPDALVVSCLDAAAEQPHLESAVDKRIPVLNFDSPCTDSLVQGFVGRFNNLEDGVEAAKVLAAALDYEGEVAVLAGSPAAIGHQQRVAGFRQAMAEHQRIVIVEEVYDYDDLERAATLTASMIRDHPQLDGIFGANASAPIGAGRAIEKVGKGGEIALVGMDDLPEMMEYVHNGTAVATIVQNVQQIGYKSVEHAIALADGREIPTVYDTGSQLVTTADVASDWGKDGTGYGNGQLSKSAMASPERESYHLAFVPKLAHPWYEAVREGADQAVADFAEMGVNVTYTWYTPMVRRAPETKGRGAFLEVEDYGDGDLLSGVSLKLHENEVLGIAGLVGSGRTELARLIFGADQRTAGKLTLSGETIDIRSPSQAVGCGIGYLSENRKEEGLNLGLSLENNVVITDFEAVARYGVVSKRKVRRLTKSYIDRIRIKGSPDNAVLTLSGGNQQKVAIAKWIHAGCKVLIFDEPTRGVDVGAKSEIHALIRQYASQGRAAIVISSEAEELADVCDRVLIMAKGNIVHVLEGNEVNKDVILQFVTKGVELS